MYQRSPVIGAAAVAGLLFASVGVGLSGGHAEEPVPGVTTRGVIKALSRAIIGAELVARVSELPFRSGQTFDAGALLVAFDCTRYEADYRAADADVRAAAGELRTSERLHNRGAAGAFDVELARAKHAGAEARAESLAALTSQCKIIAPYTGRVVTTHIRPHEMPTANAPLLEIVSTEGLEIDLIVPSDWLSWLSVGEELSFEVDETKSVYRASVVRVGAVVDPISQTVRVFARFTETGENGELLPGMSGSATFDHPAS